MDRFMKFDDSCPICGGIGHFQSGSDLKRALGLGDKCGACKGTGRDQSSGGSSAKWPEAGGGGGGSGGPVGSGDMGSGFNGGD